jgi:MFS transporter, SP family, general alpha glucoside:H+ symporter
MEGRRKSSVVEVARADDGVLRVDDGAIRRMSVANPDIPTLHQEAKNATANELNMTVREALKLYPKVVIFSVIFSTAVVMEGYDLSLMGSFYAFTAFKNFFGDQPDPEEGGRLISAPWQTGIGNGAQVRQLSRRLNQASSAKWLPKVGSIIGLYLDGIISEAIGYRKTMFGSLILMIAFIFIPFFARNLGTLLAGAVLQGLP